MKSEAAGSIGVQPVSAITTPEARAAAASPWTAAGSRSRASAS
jgi:hypothetical protein